MSDPAEPGVDDADQRLRTGRAGAAAADVLRRLGGWVALILVAAMGAAIGWQLAPSATAKIGPLQLKVAAVVGQDAPAVLDLPPIGEVAFDTHAGPLGIRASLLSVDADAAQRLLGSPQQFSELRRQAPDALRGAVLRAVAQAVGSGLAGAAVAGFVVYRSRRRCAQAVLFALIPAVVGSGIAAGTFDPNAVGQPTFTGLLSRAPYIAAQTRLTADRLEAYRSGVDDMVRSVTTLYTAADQLPVLQPDPSMTTLLHVSDIHLNPQSFDLIGQLVSQFTVDAVLDTGDITTWGTAAESRTLAPIGGLGVPYVFVRGNHDSAETAAAVAAQPGALVLDRSSVEVAGLTVAGIGDLSFTPDGQGHSREKAAEAAALLAQTITSSTAAGRPVDIAMIHDPSRLDPLMGEAPLVLSGHYHIATERMDESGTRVMVEGSTGGAGVSRGALDRLEAGTPLPLEATLLYFGSRAGQPRPQLLAYDHVVVAGLGLASVSVQRTIVDPDERPGDPLQLDVVPVDRPHPTPLPTAPATPASAPASSPRRRRPVAPEGGLSTNPG
jgi:predicted phosphodiesterase